MKEELNIAAILKDKPAETKLWSPIVGNCTFEGISSKTGAIIASFIDKDGEQLDWDFNEYGKTLSAPKEAEVCLFPSKEMLSWEKFAWKKGDVLCSMTGDSCIFIKWISDDYTSFLGYYSTHKNYENEECQTAIWSKRTNKENIEQYIIAIEAVKNGTLNLETLEIEQPNPEFKDGDIMVIDEDGLAGAKCIFILRNNMSYIDEYTHYYAFLNVNDERIVLDNILYDNRTPRLATDSEKQELFDALAKKGKKWNLDTKQIENLPKKYVFAPFQKVLVRYENCQAWKADFFSYYDDSSKDFPYVCVSSRSCCCIPYNDKTKHLLGTTDDLEGGEG